MARFHFRSAMAKMFHILPAELRAPVIGGLIVAAIGALILTPIGTIAVSWIQSFLTKHGTNTEALRVTYYRVSGLGLRLLTDGCLTPEWLKVFGQHPSIVNNTVLTEVHSFLEEYGTPLDGDLLYGEYPKERSRNEYNRVQISDIMRSSGCVKERHPANSDLKTYLGGRAGTQLFVPDIRAATTMFKTLNWPSDYEFGNVNYDGTLPSIWRYITAGDLKHYETQYHDYETRLLDSLRSDWRWTNRTAGHDIYSETHLNFAIVRSLRYVTQGGVPEGFMAVVGGPGTHGGWAFSAEVRDLELLVAVYENVTSASINIGEFSYRELTQRSLRTEDETTRQMHEAPINNKALYSVRILKPGESIMVPLRIQFALPEQSIERESNPPWGLGVNSRVSVRQVGSEEILVYENLYEPATYESMFEKRLSDYRAPRQARLMRRFDFGPGWDIESVVINGTMVASRAYDRQNFLLYAGTEKGSCPIVVSFDPDLGLWHNQGEILVNAIGQSRKREDKLVLHDFHGTVEIREKEAEITILDSAAIVLMDKHTLSEEWLFFDIPELKASDDRGVVLRSGESIRKDVNSYGRDWGQYEVSLIVNGYYVPFAMQASATAE